MPKSAAEKKFLTWKNVSLIGEAAGWYTKRLDRNKVVLERPRQKIVARRVEGDNWKIEYYEDGRLEDMAGVTKSDFATREMAEMAVLKFPVA